MRPITADLRDIKDDGRRWWAVAGDGYGTPWFYPARSGREAVARHRRDSIEADVACGYSRRESTLFIRAHHLTYEGPYTAAEAFVLDAGCHLALEVCNSYTSMTTPGGPITDLDECAPMLTERKVAAILDTVAAHYRTAQSST